MRDTLKRTLGRRQCSLAVARHGRCSRRGGTNSAIVTGTPATVARSDPGGAAHPVYGETGAVQKVHADASERAERAAGASYSRGVKSVASIWGNTSPLLAGPLYLPSGQPPALSPLWTPACSLSGSAGPGSGVGAR